MKFKKVVKFISYPCYFAYQKESLQNEKEIQHSISVQNVLAKKAAALLISGKNGNLPAFPRDLIWENSCIKIFLEIVVSDLGITETIPKFYPSDISYEYFNPFKCSRISRII